MEIPTFGRSLDFNNDNGVCLNPVHDVFRDILEHTDRQTDIHTCTFILLHRYIKTALC